MLMNKTMPNTTIETPDWLREMETILEELNEGVVVLDDELRVIFANEALTLMAHFDREEIQGRTPDAIFPSEDLPCIKRQHESGLRYGRNRTEFYFPVKTVARSQQSSVDESFRVPTSRTTSYLP
jgi:PAS domain S-box-containing protein